MKTCSLGLIYGVCKAYWGDGFDQRTRRRIYADRRHMFYLVAVHYGFTHDDIGRYMGYSHSTVTYGATKMGSWLGIYKGIKQEYDALVSAVDEELETQMVLENN